jgi:CRISPR system Cascade subunit CasC
MSRFVSLHTWTAYGPSALNLGEDKLPKDVRLGGTTRQRVSSQAIRRARRLLMQSWGLSGSTRTRLLRARLAQELVVHGRDFEDALDVARAGLRAVGLGFDKKKPAATQYPLFVADSEIDALTKVLHRAEVWNALKEAAAVPEDDDENGETDGEVGTTSRRRPKSSKKTTGSAPDTKEAREALMAAFDPSDTAALALWGRMVADKPELNCTGAVQDTHLIGVDELVVQDDFWAAVDDLGDLSEDRGAATIGTAHFSTSLMYGQTTVDRSLLASNLRNNDVFTRQVLGAYMRAVVEAVPGGRQNTMAARPLPSLVVAEVGDWQPTSYVEHCHRAISHYEGHGDLIASTVERLDQFLHWRRETYGQQGRMIVVGHDLERMALRRVPMEDLIAQVLAE